MDIQVLGPVEASVYGRSIPLGGGKPRALLAMLALNGGSTVSTERLIDGLWGEEPPASANKLVQVYVSQLRKALGSSENGAEIVTRPRGYELRVAPDVIDAERFERLVASGAPREALALWRGPPLDDVADEPFAAVEIRRLEALRLAALELAIDRDLEEGRHREVVAELEALVAAEPLRERLHAQRMLALYRCGRQADALAAYRQARAALVEAIGAEPGPELRRLHEAILRQDPSLALPAAVELPPELDADTPLAGRDSDLEWVRELWRGAHGGVGRLVLVTGARGMGKTRLAAALAGEVHRDRGTVLYVSGAGAPDAALGAIARAGAAPRPTLLVLDDVDRAGEAVLAALDELAGRLAALPVLVLATAEQAQLRADSTLCLGPLHAAAVRAVAELYAATSDEAAERLLQDSGGVPQQVHRLAAESARSASARRIDAFASRAAAERAGLRTAEDELAGEVVQLQALRERAERREATPEPVACPFKGLASFDVEDAAFFFGRERLVAAMVARLAGAPLVGIVGPSGSGKSSALRAGLLPALASGVLPGSERWGLALLRPGEHPLRALQHATAYAAPRVRHVVAVDQFEEAFTACREEGERAAFVDALVASTHDPRRPTLVLVAVRADFYGRCAIYPELWRLLGANQVPVGPMSRDELRRAIELPAQRAGLLVEPELVDALIADVAGEPGALPLLSTALLELWQQRDGRRMRLGAYRQSGGVHRAVARLAERAYERLDPEQQETARRILLRLAGEGEGDAAVRRRVQLSELEGELVADVLAVLADDRLVTIGEGEVEVAHEALLREWPRLRGWLEEDVDGRRLHQHLAAAARDWEAGGRDTGELYRGARLASTLDWAADHDSELNATERAFLDHSRRASGRAQRRLRMVLAGVAFLLVLAVIAGAVALKERGNARAEATAAAAQRLGAQALADDNLDRALLLARQGVALDDSLQTRGNLLAALLKSPAVIGVLRGDGDRLTSLALSPDERTLAFVDDDGMLTIVDTRTRRPAARPQTLPGPVAADGVRFSNDGSRIAVGGEQPVVLDARTRRVLARLPLHDVHVSHDLRFSADGRTLFALMSLPWGASIQRFDARNGRPFGREQPIPRRSAQVTLMVTRDGRRLVTSIDGGPTVVHDARTLRPLKRFPVGAEQAALSPDDRTLLAGRRDGAVRFLDLVTGKLRTASTRHDGAVVRAAFSADGDTAVTAGEDNRVMVWNVERAAAAETLEGNAAQIIGLAISRGGQTLYTAALDGKVLIWDLAGNHRLGRPFDIGPANQPGSRSVGPVPVDIGPPLNYALSPDGKVLAVGHGDGKVTRIDARTLRPLSTFRALAKGPVGGIGYVPGGRLLVVGGDDGILALADPQHGKLVKPLPGHRSPAFSADGRIMATLSAGNISLWTLQAGQPLGNPRRYYPAGGAFHVSLSPDGRTLAVTSVLGVEIVDVATLRRRTSLTGSETVLITSFTPDGRFIVGGSSKGWARLWSTDSWRPAGRALAGHTREVLGLASSPDSRTLATGSTDGTIRLFDLRTQQPLGTPLPGVPNHPVYPQFTPDGTYLFAITNAGRAYRWDMRPASWVRYACAVAGRTLTRTEWNDALPAHHYQPACTATQR
jgi:WD40 repeat protein/DNA-binding SARP family transcriptional activator/energy-coupling factor transporter ATP-binding protein EcfA2